MKRDWDIIREILLTLEEYGNEAGPLQISWFPDNRAAEISYHMELLIEAGLVCGEMRFGGWGEADDFYVSRMTWQGHELLDAIRNDTVWQKTKKSFINGGVSMTLDLIKSAAGEIAGSILKSTMGG